MTYSTHPPLSEDLLAAIRESIYAEERLATRQRIVRGFEHAAATGRWPCGRPPYGFTTGPNPNGPGRVLVPHPDEADTIRLAVGMILDDDLPVIAVVDRLNRSGRPFRTQPWTTTTLRRVLRSSALSGTQTWRGPRSGRVTSGPPITFAVPAILDPDTHTRVLAKIRTRKNP